MATSKVQIVNQALGLLGKGGITSFEDGTKEANLALRLYDDVRDATLEEKDWTFATKRFSNISPLSISPAYGYSHSFVLDPAVIRVIEVNRNLNDWVREENLILSDDDIINIRAVIRITDTLKYSPGFTSTLISRLAAEFAIPLTQSKKLRDSYWQDYYAKLSSSGSQDGKQGKSQKIRNTDLTLKVR